MTVQEAVALLWKMREAEAATVNRYEAALDERRKADPAAEVGEWESETNDAAAVRREALDIAMQALTIDPRD
jgi:hypothetical protein